jgi:hypothetical protein
MFNFKIFYIVDWVDFLSLQWRHSSMLLFLTVLFFCFIFYVFFIVFVDLVCRKCKCNHPTHLPTQLLQTVTHTTFSPGFCFIAFLFSLTISYECSKINAASSRFFPNITFPCCHALRFLLVFWLGTNPQISLKIYLFFLPYPTFL